MTAPVSPPIWVIEWCQVHLGSRAEGLLFDAGQMSEVFGVRLDDGREVVLKVRPSDGGRARACVEVQRRVAAAGLPCAVPVGNASELDGRTIHAEQWRPGGRVRHDEGPEHATQAAQVLASLMRVTSAAGLPAGALAPNPVWVRWEHSGSATPRHRTRRLGSAEPWWDGEAIHTIHDWDSLAALPEAAVVGAAAGAFASTNTPTLAPLASSESFLAAYEDAAGRRFTSEEIEVAWAASMYPAAHNARGEVLFGTPPVAADALSAQANERLRRGGA